MALAFSSFAFLTGCLFESVNQPVSAEPGEVIDISLTITDNIVPEPNAHKGVLGIIVPSDWEFISATYTSVIGNGTLDISPEWKDSIELFYPTDQFGPGMKWIALISDQGYSYDNVTSFSVQLKLKVGQTLGCFNLGYLTTKATSGLISSGNTSWAPISFPHPIGVPYSSGCNAAYETRSAGEWDDLFDRSSGWTGADGIYSIPLNEFDATSDNPAGKQLILFSDTFIGEVDSSNKRVNTKLINNTLALLQSNSPNPSDIQFFWKEDSTNAPKTVFVPNTPNANPGDWYWLMDGIALNDTIYVFALRLNHTTGGLGFEVNGVVLLKFNLDSANFISDVEQFDTPLFFKNESEGWDIVMGQAVMPMTISSGNPSPDGYIYIYGPKSGGGSGKELVAARVLSNEIGNFQKWKFWNGTEWGSDIANCVSLTNGISQEFSVTPIASNKYLVVYQLGNSVAFRMGESPIGPFGIFHSIYNCPEVLIDPDVFVYNAKAHPSLSNKKEMLISYNVNSFSFADNLANADIYRPRFIYLKINDSTTSVKPENINVPEKFSLNQNYPNPFNPFTKISFSIAKAGKVSIKIYNAVGQMVSELVNKNYDTGNYEAEFSTKSGSTSGGNSYNLSSGVYFCKMEAGEFVQTIKMILIK